MKKRFFAALVVALMLGMSTVSMASRSPSPGGLIIIEDPTPPEDPTPAAPAPTPGVDTSPTRVDSPTAAPETAAFAATAGTTTSASGAVLSAKAADATTIATMNAQTKALSPLAYVLSTADYSGTIKAGGENIALSCMSVKASDTVDTIVVLHMGKNGMEVLKPSAVSAGSVTVFLTDLSPITITHVPAGTTVQYTNLKAGKTTSSSSGSNAKKSPKTGEE